MLSYLSSVLGMTFHVNVQVSHRCSHPPQTVQSGLWRLNVNREEQLVSVNE